MLKRFVRAATATCLAASLAATAPAIAQTTLEFPTWQAEEPGVSTWWKDLVAAYEKKHPDVKLNLQQVPFAQFVKQMTVRFAAGNPPDIVHLPSRDFASFADQGWLEPLDARLARTDIPANWPALQSEMHWNGKTQGVLLMGYGGMRIASSASRGLPKMSPSRTTSVSAPRTGRSASLRFCMRCQPT